MPQIIMTVAALLLALWGGALLFAPDELLPLYGVDGTASIVLQQFGIALLALALANWIACASALGGIYGRAVVSGNLLYFGATFLLYCGVLLDGGSGLMLWSHLIVSGVLGVLFALMLFGRIEPSAA